MNRTGLILAIVAGIVLSSRPSAAQYTADFQTNIISGVTSNWTGSYYVGYTNFADVLLVQNGGVLTNFLVFTGYQISGSNNSIAVTGTGSVWYGGTVIVGYWGASNRLTILNGGRVFGQAATVGNSSSSSNNVVLVSGSGSVWSNSNDLRMGQDSANNQLIITNCGVVFNDYIGYLGYSSISGSNNVATVTGSGSVWSNGYSLQIGRANNKLTIADGATVYVRFNSSMAGIRNMATVTGSGSIWTNGTDLYVGEGGAGNSLVISNGGCVANVVGYIGRFSSSTNSVRVADAAVWRNDILRISDQGSSNSLVVAGGSVLATNLIVGYRSATCDNLLQLDDGDVIVTNATTNAVFEVRNGQFILNGGTLQVDRFVMTNSCAQFVRTGGTLIYGTALLDPNRDDDDDGIPNGWEQSHGRDPLNAADVNADTDGDGQSDLAEFQAGTDPANSTSAFRIIEIAPVDDDVFLTWTTVGGKKYAVQTLTGSYTSNFTELAPAFIAPGSNESTFSVIHLGGATNMPGRFYRVRLVP